MGETILALSALTMNLLTVLVGVKYANRSREKVADISGNIYSLQERVEKAEEAVNKCIEERDTLKMDNYRLMKKLAETEG